MNGHGLRNQRILVAVLNWGLGHATRSIPLIREFQKNNTVIIATTGRSLKLLRQEFPECEFVDFPDYDIHYSRNKLFLFVYLLLQLPKMLFRLHLERYRTKKIVNNYKIDMIFSDNRYGVTYPRIPCFLMTHQLQFRLPKPVRIFEFISVIFNKLMFRRFQGVFIPDIEGDMNLSGDLGHSRAFRNLPKVKYFGLLSGIERQDVIDTIDMLVMISGPEPQRSIFEKKLIEQLNAVPGRVVMVLGKPDDERQIEKNTDLEIIPHVSRSKMSELMNSAKLIVARAGYSTIMEIAALEKPALLIPTPGQTEQEYLARRLKNLGIYHCVDQDEMNLCEDIKKVQKIGVPRRSFENINNVVTVLSAMNLSGN